MFYLEYVKQGQYDTARWNKEKEQLDALVIEVDNLMKNESVKQEQALVAFKL